MPDLRRAVLIRTLLRGAALSRADLRGATGVTGEQLARAKMLEGATMPNGQTYEDWYADWLKSRGSGPS